MLPSFSCITGLKAPQAAGKLLPKSNICIPLQTARRLYNSMDRNKENNKEITMMNSIRYGILAGTLILCGCDVINDLPLGAAYVAKNVCNGFYVSGYDRDPLLNDYVTHIVPNLQQLWIVDINESAQTVAVTNKVHPNDLALAIYRPPLGCVNVGQADADTLSNQVPQLIIPPTLSTTQPWPYGNGSAETSHLSGAVIAALESRIDSEFADADAKTVATIVIHQNKLIHERYAGGLNASSPVKGYSMSKTLVNALAGLLFDRSLLEPTEPAGFRQWQSDDRAAITIDDLIRMTSGLDHHELAYGKNNDQARLLYGDQLDPIAYAFTKTLAIDEGSAEPLEPGTHFNYSSQDNILAAKLIQDRVGSLQAMYEFYQRDLFHAIDITTAVVEHGRDSYAMSPEGVLMSPRDWARFGQLYLNRGTWEGQQVLSTEWMEYTLTPTPENISYGAGIALNTGGYLFPDVPDDAFALLGAWERYVVVIPSRETVIVRIGFSQPDQRQRINRLVADILDLL
jgi:CubicO group peptidase (beta-lactamase class C family)